MHLKDVALEYINHIYKYIVIKITKNNIDNKTAMMTDMKILSDFIV